MIEAADSTPVDPVAPVEAAAVPEKPLWKFLPIALGSFLAFLLAIAGFAAYAAYEGRDLDASSRNFVLASVPAIVSNWSKDELLKRSSPELVKAAGEHPEELDQLFQKLSKLGAMRNFDDVRGNATVSYTIRHGRVVTATYTGNAKFEHGRGYVIVRLIRQSGQWEFLLFQVDAPVFLQ